MLSAMHLLFINRMSHIEICVESYYRINIFFSSVFLKNVTKNTINFLFPDMNKILYI